VSPVDDIGGYLDFDWAKTEWRLGALYRRPLAKTGDWDFGFRIGVAWYANSGSTWIYSENHYDRGIEIAPALALSKHTGAGLLSVSGELPMVVTFHYGGGFLFSPKLAGAYELPLVPAVTVGARVAVGYRAGSGDAPLATGRGELQFLVLASYQVL
jgi:hypothetical protein